MINHTLEICGFIRMFAVISYELAQVISDCKYSNNPVYLTAMYWIHIKYTENELSCNLCEYF